MLRQFLSALLIVASGMTVACAQHTENQSDKPIVTGAERIADYLPMLKNKQVAIVANQTSVVKQTHLVDTLLSLDVNIKCVFAPEHGFRGTADAGEHVSSSTDAKTGLPIVSLYGKHKKPTTDDLQNIDIVLFDIQDVGVRFYTYISTLHYVMEACAENNISLLVLDRPNPNGFYIDGPVLDTAYRSFVGMHPVPIVHGMTIAEYAQMINGEGWLANAEKCDLKIVQCLNYTHTTRYQLPIKPSPNLPTYRSVLLYPSLGLFEGTFMSVARGTDFPFEAFGHPDYASAIFEFEPKSVAGAKNPPFKNMVCRGFDLRHISIDTLENIAQINLKYLIDSYQCFKSNPKFFNSFFTKLVGTAQLRQQIEQGLTEDEIRKSWQFDLSDFQQIRKKYLLYDDF